MTLKIGIDQRMHRTVMAGEGKAEIRMEPGSQIVVSTHWESEPSSGNGTNRWTRCSEPNCLGSAIVAGEKCFVHGLGTQPNALHLAEVRSGRRSLDLRGNEITARVWKSILADLESSQRIVGSIQCNSAIFTEKIGMDALTFTGGISFDGAIFEDGCSVHLCDFAGGLSISLAYFRLAPGYFQKCSVTNLNSAYCHTQQHVGFADCDFQEIRGQGADKSFILTNCTVRRLCDLSRVNVDFLDLRGSRFEGILALDRSNAKTLHASGIHVTGGSTIGPIETETIADLSRARFEQRVRIVLSASSLLLVGSAFDGGGRVEAQGASIDLTDLVVKAPLSVSGHDTSSVQSVQNADCGKLTFSSLDLSTCHFYGCHNLMDIGIESTVKFASPPSRLHAKRQCIADELSWRAAYNKRNRSSWKKVAEPMPGNRYVLSPGQVAGIYRALRKSLETQSNEPGAADFYYGEMEMRRRDQRVSRWERVIVSAYWFMSGYGLRGLRATILLLIAFLGGSAIMYMAGIEKPHKWPISVVTSAQSMVPGVSVSENLTTTGKASEVVLRIAGPVLFGLALLAIRNRIRR